MADDPPHNEAERPIELSNAELVLLIAKLALVVSHNSTAIGAVVDGDRKQAAELLVRAGKDMAELIEILKGKAGGGAG